MSTKQPRNKLCIRSSEYVYILRNITPNKCKHEGAIILTSGDAVKIVEFMSSYEGRYPVNGFVKVLFGDYEHIMQCSLLRVPEIKILDRSAGISPMLIYPNVRMHKLIDQKKFPYLIIKYDGKDPKTRNVISIHISSDKYNTNNSVLLYFRNAKDF